MNNKQEKTKRERSPRIGLVLLGAAIASLVVIGTTATMPTAAATTTSEITITATCELANLSSGGRAIEVEFNREGGDPDATYFEKISDSSGRVIGERSTRGGDTGTAFAPATPGETYTMEIRAEGPDGEVVATESVTCPELTELFSNQGECIEEVQDPSFRGLTKNDCKNAFKKR
jgi:hypothetical protein